MERFGEMASNLAVTKLFATGARVTVGLTNDLLHFYSNPSRNVAAGAFTASLVQPLLRGVGPLGHYGAPDPGRTERHLCRAHIQPIPKALHRGSDHRILPAAPGLRWD